MWIVQNKPRDHRRLRRSDLAELERRGAGAASAFKAN